MNHWTARSPNEVDVGAVAVVVGLSASVVSRLPRTVFVYRVINC